MRLRVFLLMLIIGCDDPSASRTDAVGDAVTDARADAVADAHTDARAGDSSVGDGARPPVDAAIRDNGLPDALVDAGLPACEGIALPPPPDSPDGSEVCNYRDDDGDGRVDEGFAYDFLGEPVRITPDPQSNPRDYRIVWTGREYGVAWVTSFGLSFMTLDTSGCPTSRLWLIDQNPLGDPFAPDSGDMAFSGDRFAAMFTQLRVGPPGSGIGTFIQLFDRSGRPVGDLIDLDPRLSFFGKNAIVPFGDQFAVFASAFDPETGGLTYSVFAILDQEGRVVVGPSHPYNPELGQGQAMSDFIGMAFDGEGFGMAWEGEGSWFMRWSPEGEVLVPPQPVGVFGQRSGIAWTGMHYVVPTNARDTVSLDFIGRDGSAAPWSPVLVGNNPSGWAGVSPVVAAADQVLVVAAVERLILRRYSQLGTILGPDAMIGSLELVALTAFPGGLTALVIVDWDPVVGRGHIALTRFGCSGPEGG